jgi:FkbM family methyltransferase
VLGVLKQKVSKKGLGFVSSHPFYPPENCRKLLFIDLGANRGDVSSAFVKCFLSNKHTKKAVLRLHIVEPLATIHKDFVGNFKTIERRFNHPDDENGSEVYLHKKVAWTHDGTIEFRVGKKARNTNSTVSDVAKLNESCDNKLQRARDIECIDVSTWLRKLINDEQFDAIFVKMDIEGSEYHVIDKMIADNSLMLIDKLFIEFHKRFPKVPEIDTINEYVKKMHDAAPELRIYKETKTSGRARDLYDKYHEV